MTRGRSLLANASANLVVGIASLGYAVIVPSVVVRRFGADAYGTWYLAFQVAAYIVLLDLGSQYLVANAAATPAPDRRSARLTTAAMAAQTGLAATVVGAATAWAALTGQARLAQLMAVLGAAGLMSLLASTVRAWFGGLRQAHVPAMWLVGARAGSLGGLVAAVGADAGVVALTLAVAVPQVIVHGGLLVWSHRPPSPWALPDRSAVVDLARSTAPLAIWTVCGIFISGIDIFVVRAVDPSQVGRYAVALPLLAVPTGAVTAVMTAWLPRLSQADHPGRRVMTLRGTTVMAAGLSIGGLAFVGYADVLVDLLAGSGSWDAAASYLRLLFVASCLRFVLMPWAILVVVRGEQGAIVLAPVVEAATNLLASVVLGLWLGAVGVAIGTIVGACVGAVGYMTWGIRRTALSGVRAATVFEAIGSAWIPITAAAASICLALVGAPGMLRVVATAGAFAVSACWLVRWRRGAVGTGQPGVGAAAHP
jgi:O-antigen/teichoic acid export membrane protein